MSDQAMLVALKCPNCAGALKVGPEMSAFACGYCGANVVVKREGGTVSLGLEAAIAKVQRGTDKTAAELAIKRLLTEIGDLESQKLVQQASFVDWARDYGQRRQDQNRTMDSPFAMVVIFGFAATFNFFLGPVFEEKHAGLWSLLVIVVGAGAYFARRSAFKEKNAKLAAEFARCRADVEKAIAVLDRTIADRNGRLAENRAIAES